MRRRFVATGLGLGLGLGWVLACSTVGNDAPPEPALAAATPKPEPEPLHTDAEPSPEPPPDDEIQPDDAEPRPPEPTEPPAKPWAAEDERRILAVQPVVAEAAAAHGVDPYLVNGVIWVESKFHRKARNRSGARGLMQLMPKTAKALGRALRRPAKVYDPAFNVHAGTYYLSRLLARFDGDETLALAAYARGPGRVRTWVDAGEPLPDGVVRFIEKVQHARAVFVALGWPELEPEPEPAATDDPSRAPEPVASAPAG